MVGVEEGDVLVDAAGRLALMWPWWRIWAPPNQAEVGRFTERP
jgi:hypothetical protein